MASRATSKKTKKKEGKRLLTGLRANLINPKGLIPFPDEKTKRGKRFKIS
jgi:threonine/homoserine/homoserine lactone efflux protein